MKTDEEIEQDEKRRSFIDGLKQNIWLFIATALYTFIRYLLNENPSLSPWSVVGLKMLPIIPGLVYLWVGLGIIRQMDELEQRIQFEALLFAAFGTVVILATVNVMNSSGILVEKFPHGLEIGGTYLAMFCMWCIGITYAKSRYK